MIEPRRKPSVWRLWVFIAGVSMALIGGFGLHSGESIALGLALAVVSVL